MHTTDFLLTAKQRILFAGHSLISRRSPPYHDTWPFLRLMHGDRTWVDDLSEILFCLRPDLDLTFHTIYGTALAHIVSRHDECIAPYRPDWIFLATGDNDARMKVPLEAFQRDAAEFVRRVADLSACRVVVLGGPTTEGAEGYDPASAPYHSVLREIGDRAGGIYIDVDTTLIRKHRQLRESYAGHTIHLTGDGHLNAIGNMIVAWKVLTALGFAWVD